MLRVDVITIFPNVFEPYLSEGMIRIAREKCQLETHLHNLRDWTQDKHKSVDDRPYGGGPGMVMMCGPVFDAVESVAAMAQAKPRVILTSPQGRKFDQRLAEEISREQRLVIVCGRYEGYDERIIEGLGAEEISIGDYVLTGGELPAMVMIDAATRLLPGVLGHEESAKLDSFTCEGGLDYPHYTRPAEFRGMTVPEILLSGNHKQIADWRAEHSRQKTIERRPDIFRNE